GFPVKQAELYDPATGQWTPMASANHGRTYHNSAALLPDGSVLVGGHSPIPNGYGAPMTTPGGFSNGFRDPTFEIYRPPYLFWGHRPVIRNAPDRATYGGTITVQTPDAASIDQAVLVRNTAVTHLTDGDQREVQLTVVRQTANSLTLAVPANPSVLPPAPTCCSSTPAPPVASCRRCRARCSWRPRRTGDPQGGP